MQSQKNSELILVWSRLRICAFSYGAFLVFALWPDVSPLLWHSHDKDRRVEQVTDSNKIEFVAALIEWRLFGSIEMQLSAMRRGLLKVGL